MKFELDEKYVLSDKYILSEGFILDERFTLTEAATQDSVIALAETVLGKISSDAYDAKALAAQLKKGNGLGGESGIPGDTAGAGVKELSSRKEAVDAAIAKAPNNTAEDAAVSANIVAYFQALNNLKTSLGKDFDGVFKTLAINQAQIKKYAEGTDKKAAYDAYVKVAPVAASAFSAVSSDDDLSSTAAKLEKLAPKIDQAKATIKKISEESDIKEVNIAMYDKMLTRLNNALPDGIISATATATEAGGVTFATKDPSGLAKEAEKNIGSIEKALDEFNTDYDKGSSDTNAAKEIASRSAHSDWYAYIKSKKTQQEKDAAWDEYFKDEYGDNAEKVKNLGKDALQKECAEYGFTEKTNPFVKFIKQHVIGENLNMNGQFVTIHNLVADGTLTKKDIDGTGDFGESNLIFNNNLYQNNATDIKQYLTIQSNIRTSFKANLISAAIKLNSMIDVANAIFMQDGDPESGQPGKAGGQLKSVEKAQELMHTCFPGYEEKEAKPTPNGDEMDKMIESLSAEDCKKAISWLVMRYYTSGDKGYIKVIDDLEKSVPGIKKEPAVSLDVALAVAKALQVDTYNYNDTATLQKILGKLAAKAWPTK